MLTPRDIHRVLGLDDPDEFEARAIRSQIPLRLPLRRSGRTTRMLCLAVAHALGGHWAFIDAHSVDYARQLTWVARDYAIRCGANPNLIRAGSATRGQRGAVTLTDHHVLDAGLSTR